MIIGLTIAEYKLDRGKFLSERLEQLRAQLEDRFIAQDEWQLVEASMYRFAKQRDQVYAMWTWPFGKAESVKYGGVFPGNLVVSLKGLKEFLDKIELAKIL